MLWIVAILFALMLLASVLKGAPYVPTHTKQVELALDLLDLEEGDQLVDVGSGDGKVLVVGAKRGLRVIGYEINPILWAVSWLRTRRYKTQVKTIWGDMWAKKLPDDTKGIFVFTMGKYMNRLEKKILKQGLSGVHLASHGFKLPGRKPKAQKEAIFLYKID